MKLYRVPIAALTLSHSIKLKLYWSKITYIDQLDGLDIDDIEKRVPNINRYQASKVLEVLSLFGIDSEFRVPNPPHWYYEHLGFGVEL